MRKQIIHMRIDSALRESVKQLAESEYKGNFTSALESLVGQALEIRSIALSTRLAMYDHVKQQHYEATEAESGKPNVRQLIDALHI